MRVATTEEDEYLQQISKLQNDNKVSVFIIVKIINLVNIYLKYFNN